LLANRPKGGVLRAWTPGCSTGEEAYSLAIVFREALEKVKPAARYSLQVFATDLDKDAIAKARAGAYPANISTDVAAARLRRFFVQERGYRVSKEIRDMVIFAPQNLAMDPPFTKLDLLMCRNLLIYLETDRRSSCLFFTTASIPEESWCWGAPRPWARLTTSLPRFPARHASFGARNSPRARS
jgi:two-component system CheB/CheR fusion protein